jgi:hypothetical protein
MSAADESLGAVRIRSNIVFDPYAWELVPGELYVQFRRGRLQPLQHKEKMYYAPCSRCWRVISAINLEGCLQCQDSPTPEQAASMRKERERRLVRARERERRENDALRRGKRDSNAWPRG